jgi:AcrR family transcriptional regulator
MSAEPDGRRRRGEDNRRKIVTAFMDFVREGRIGPTAEEIAARADVGLRTVFRHFDDMESLYREIATEIEAQVRPLVDRPFTAANWRGRLDELVQRRAALFERIMPFRIAADVHRHESSMIAERQRDFVKLQRAYLREVLPRPIGDDRLRLEALDLVTSYEAWRRLRHEQQLSPEDAERAMAMAVRALIAGTSP